MRAVKRRGRHEKHAMEDHKGGGWDTHLLGSYYGCGRGSKAEQLVGSTGDGGTAVVAVEVGQDWDSVRLALVMQTKTAIAAAEDMSSPWMNHARVRHLSV